MSVSDTPTTDPVSSTAPVTPAALTASGATLDMEFEYEGESGKFQVYSIGGQPLVITDVYRLAIAQNPAGQLGIAMIAADVTHNEYVERQFRMANSLQTIATKLDGKHAELKDAPKYGALFPTAIETFDSADGRLGVFLGYHPIINRWDQLVPMSVALSANRADMKSSAWMLGKGLKLLNYLHDLGFTLNFMDASNMFLETAQHGVFVLDLSNVNESASDADMLAEVAELAAVIYWAIGGNDENEPPHDEGIMTAEEHREFVDFLKQLMKGETTARAAFDLAYAMYDRIWPKQPGGSTGQPKRDWHEYTTHPRVAVEE